MNAIRALSTRVSDEYRRSTEAHNDVARASEEILADVVADVLPALPAIADRITIAYSLDRTAGKRAREHSEYHTVRGVCLTGDPGPTASHPSEFYGSYLGSDVFLLSDGSLVRLSYSGEYAPDRSKWRAEVASADTGELGVDDTVRLLSNRLTRALGTRDRATSDLRARAERLRAVATLLRR